MKEIINLAVSKEFPYIRYVKSTDYNNNINKYEGIYRTIIFNKDNKNSKIETFNIIDDVNNRLRTQGLNYVKNSKGYIRFLSDPKPIYSDTYYILDLISKQVISYRIHMPMLYPSIYPDYIVNYINAQENKLDIAEIYFD